MHITDLEPSLAWEHVIELVQLSQNTSKKWIDYFQDDEKIILQNVIPSLNNNDEITHQYIF